MKFNELKVSRKLQIYAFFVSLIFIFGGLMSLNSVGRLSGSIEHTYTDNMVPTIKISGILEQLLEHRILLRTHILSSSQEEMKKLRSEMAKIQAEVTALTEAKDQYSLLADERDLTGEQEKIFSAFANNLKPLFDSSQGVLQLSESFSKEDADRKMLTESPVFERSKEALLKLIKLKEDEAKASYEASFSIKKTTRLMTLLIIFGGLGIVMISSVFITRSISASINTAVTTISTSATQIAATITQHERTASQQVTAASETSATITELSVSSRQSAEQAANAAAVAEKATTATAQGGDATHHAVAAMGNLKDRIAAMADQILRLGEQTGQIGSIATLVKDLSGEINMLALNAAVEAARAGEHGKGFAVVAGEVRKLASQSKKSAEQASALVADIQKATNSSIMMTEEGTRTVNEVTQLVQKVAELFGNISGMAGNVNENAQQVMLNAKQQSAAFTQIVEATNNITAGAKETAAGLSQTRIGVQKLNEAAENLKAIA